MTTSTGKWNKYKERKNKGLCIYCGKTVPIPDRRGCLKCLEKHSKETTDYEKKHKEKKHQYRLRLKSKVIEKYGGKCACCGETQLLFLSMDHKNNDGAIEMIKTYWRRRSLSLDWYRKLIRDPLRNDLQVLCFNCNMGKQMNCGTCPHKKIIRQLLPFVDERFKPHPHFDRWSKIKWPENDKLIEMCNKTSTTEVSRKLGVTFGTVRSRLTRRGLYHLVMKRQGNRVNHRKKDVKNADTASC